MSHVGLNNTHKSEKTYRFRISVHDMHMPSTAIIDISEFKVVKCVAQGRANTSAFLQYNAITRRRRACFGTSTMHAQIDAVAESVKRMVTNENTV